jgi:pimeloyl-ACP methyl ester carboxylesterase
MSGPISQAATKRVEARTSVPPATIHRVEADGVRMFCRAMGDANAPVVHLLHGLPASSFMFRELIPRLVTDYRLIAPDLPGFGFTEVSAERKYVYSFNGLASTVGPSRKR